MTQFNQGDSVKIIDSKNKSEVVYNIKKIKKAQDGTTLYLLKSDISPITLLYYESDESHLENI